MGELRKSLSLWLCCEKCQSTLMQKDLPAHESNCPPLTEMWNYNYLRDGVLYSTLECYASQVRPQYVSEQEMDKMIFMTKSAMTLCEIPLGGSVVITTVSGEKIVRTAWPTDDKNFTSVSMTRKGMESSRVEGPVKLNKLSCEVYLAREIEIEYTGKQPFPEVTVEMEIMIKGHNEDRIFTVGNRMTVPYYGKRLGFKIVTMSDVYADGTDSIQMNVAEGDMFYKASFSTKWLIKPSNKAKEVLSEAPNVTVAEIGGYDTVIANLKHHLDVALGKLRKLKRYKMPKGILLYGTSGVGKSAIANAVLAECSAKVFAIKRSDFQKKIANETELRLSNIFEEALLKAPSVIFIEDIDCLCPRKGDSSAVIEKLASFMDEIRTRDANVAVLATASRLDCIDGALCCRGRFHRKIEVCSPTPKMRKEILLKLLVEMPNRLSEDDVDVVASMTHGFVGADLAELCTESVSLAVMRFHSTDIARESNLPDDAEDDIVVELRDFMEALETVKPSAMNGVFVEVPNVKWTEIGGQEGLKLELKQMLEWPLRHPEVFTRLGMTPPRGLLMFGPPGCSKTMIAKALATESKLNFINIKGPELFSKWVGDSEKDVREIFRKARQVSPSIIFIDEIDSLGCHRGSSGNESGGSNVQERVLTQLLMELDGVTALGNVALIAATNRPDRIDKALLRPGRFDNVVYVPLPDADTRLEIFAIKMRKMPIAQDVIIQDLVDRTKGYSGAEIELICKQAGLKAAAEDINATVITKEHFEAALSIVTPRTSPSLIKIYEDYINNCK